LLYRAIFDLKKLDGSRNPNAHTHQELYLAEQISGNSLQEGRRNKTGKEGGDGDVVKDTKFYKQVYHQQTAIIPEHKYLSYTLPLLRRL